MKKALVLTYDFPPCTAPGAALRSHKLVRYLPEFGWEVSVICRQERIDASAEAVPSPAARIVRIPAPIPPRISYQLGAWIWAGQVLPRARALITDARPDLVYASGPPFPHVLSAMSLAREARIPFVADMRDSWSLDPHLGGARGRKAIKRALCCWVYPRLERRLFESAAAILVNTPSMRRAYARMFADAAERIHLVPNGFDEADFSSPVEAPRRDIPLLRYCGRFSGVASRSPDLLLRGMRAALDAGLRIEFEILGDDSPELRSSIRRLSLDSFVRARPVAPHAEAIRAMREATILVLYQPPSRNEVTPVAGKTYEYLRSGRPILAIVPPGDCADLVQRYAPLHALVSHEEPARVGAALQDLVVRSAAMPSEEPDPEFVQTYSRREIARQIAAICNQAIGITT